MLRFTFGAFVALGSVGLVQAQTTGSTPPPPPPGRVESPVLEGPVTDLKPIVEERADRPDEKADGSGAPAVTHDALQTSRAPRAGDRSRAPKQPPAPIAERPSGRRPQPRAIWVPGYWDWDAGQTAFVWMGGVWQVPAPGTVWVNSRWMRDDDGWYRRPGFWSRRRDAVVETTAEVDDRQPAWRTTGPPSDHPPDQVADAPGPDYFLIPGHYAPTNGDQLKWKPSFWAQVQTGWDWIPARWVRRPAGWEFRAGHWIREPGEVDVKVTAGGRTAARVVTPGSVPDVGEPGVVTSPEGAIEQPPAPPGTEDERDPIAAAEAAGRVRVLVPGPGMPYYVIRPPGLYPYGPGGVVVPGTVPPFVRRILDQVLP